MLYFERKIPLNSNQTTGLKPIPAPPNYTHSGQGNCCADDVTKGLMIGTGAALFHHTLTHVQKSPIVWHIRRSRRPVAEAGEEAEDRPDWVLTVNNQRLVFHDKSRREVAQKLVDLLLKSTEDQAKSKRG